MRIHLCQVLCACAKIKRCSFPMRIVREICLIQRANICCMVCKAKAINPSAITQAALLSSAMQWRSLFCRPFFQLLRQLSAVHPLTYVSKVVLPLAASVLRSLQSCHIPSVKYEQLGVKLWLLLHRDLEKASSSQNKHSTTITDMTPPSRKPLIRK